MSLVRRGLVADAKDWKWSIARVYSLAEDGVVGVDTGWGEISFQERQL